MNIRICTPVVGDSLEEFIGNLHKTQEISEFIELRVDHIPHFSIEMVEEIKKRVNKRTIFTCRLHAEGGKYLGAEETRREILQRAIGIFDHVDIELQTMKDHPFTRDDKTKIIVSYHNFHETPNFWELQKVVYDMNQLNPDIIKIATMLTKEYESTKIYRLLTNKPHTEERIIIGMGPYGTMTRVLGPLLGGYLTYASTPYGESAPGQIEIRELQNMYKTLLS